MKIILYTSLILCLINCKKPTHNNFANDSFVEILNLREGMHFPMALNCNSLNGELLKNDVTYTKVTDNNFMKAFVVEYNRLSNEDYDKAIDARIRILYHHDKITDTICMGEHFFISVNGNLKKDSPALLKLVKDKIYQK